MIVSFTYEAGVDPEFEFWHEKFLGSLDELGQTEAGFHAITLLFGRRPVDWSFVEFDEEGSLGIVIRMNMTTKEDAANLKVTSRIQALGLPSVRNDLWKWLDRRSRRA